MPKYKAIAIFKIGHVIEGVYDNVDDFKAAVDNKFSDGYGFDHFEDFKWDHIHESVEFDGLKEGSLEQVESVIIE